MEKLIYSKTLKYRFKLEVYSPSDFCKIQKKEALNHKNNLVLTNYYLSVDKCNYLNG